MIERAPVTPQPDVVAEGRLCTTDELCLACNVEAGWIGQLVAEGVIEPSGQNAAGWQFSTIAIIRISRAKRLSRDLGLDAPGIALALDLLDEIDRLRARLRDLERPD